MTWPAKPYRGALGKKPQLAWLPVDRLDVDPKYQRDTTSRRSRHLVEKIAAEFKWARFGVVLAVNVGAQKWHVIDGQHRVEAARKRGDIASIPAVVLPHASVAEAAADFVAINRDRVAVTPLHIHHAQLAAGEPLAIDTARACRAAGVEICRYPVPLSNIKAGQTLAVATIARLVSLKGADFATSVLRRVLAEARHAPGALSARSIRLVAAELGLPKAGGYVKPGRIDAAARKRNCLRCGQPFQSEGAHNRMCDTCKRAA
jgi:hypothetical protein